MRASSIYTLLVPLVFMGLAVSLFPVFAYAQVQEKPFCRMNIRHSGQSGVAVNLNSLATSNVGQAIMNQGFYSTISAIDFYAYGSNQTAFCGIRINDYNGNEIARYTTVDTWGAGYNWRRQYVTIDPPFTFEPNTFYKMFVGCEGATPTLDTQSGATLVIGEELGFMECVPAYTWRNSNYFTTNAPMFNATGTVYFPSQCLASTATSSGGTMECDMASTTEAIYVVGTSMYFVVGFATLFLVSLVFGFYWSRKFL